MENLIFCVFSFIGQCGNLTQDGPFRSCFWTGGKTAGAKKPFNLKSVTHISQ